MRASFEYLRPGTPEDAVKMLSEYGSGAKCWAGGTDMSLHWQRSKTHPDYCVDLTYLSELDYIEVKDNEIRIGALASLVTLERSADQHALLKMLSDVTKLMCTPQTRTIATVGGNLCNASPAADLSPALVAVDALAEILGTDGTRSVPLEEFFTGVGKTSLAANEILTAVSIPLPDTPIDACYRRIDRTVVDIALVNAAASIITDNHGEIARVRIALGAVAPVIIRAPEAENVLTGSHINNVSKEQLKSVGKLAAAISKPISDVRASAEYRRAMVEVMTRRALQQTIENLGGPVK